MLTDEEPLQRLDDHEDNFTERKPPNANRQELRQTLSAFANSVPSNRPAVLFIGVHDKTGDAIGVPASETDSKQKLVREIAERDCYPPITTFKCRVLLVGSLHVVAVIVEASKDRPHFTGPAYVRRGSESVNASPEQFNELILSRNDKVRAILDMRGGLVTLRNIGQKIRERFECFVDDCDAHVVHLTLADQGMRARSIAEPLAHVEISQDTVKHRPLLIIRGHV
jgi:hypothetical protein